MFFVAVGIIILFASFIIALVSLIREQSESKDDYELKPADDFEPPEPPTSPTPPTPGEDIAHEPFFWEDSTGNSRVSGAAAEAAGEDEIIPEGEKGENLSGEISLKNLKRK